MISGMGMNSVVKIVTDRVTGCMIPEKLEDAIKEQIEKGNKPFFVNSMAGTTVMGSFDDTEAINAICKKYNIWHHVDGCWGAFVAFSPNQKHLVKGIEKVDSISFNPQKGQCLPI